MAQRPDKTPPSASDQLIDLELELGYDVVASIERATEDTSAGIEVWTEGISGLAEPWSDRQLKVARAELGDVFGDFEAGLRRCRPEDRQRWVQSWADRNVARVGLAIAFEGAISHRHNLSALGLSPVEALPEEESTPDLEVKDYAGKVVGWSREELEAALELDSPDHDGLPAAEERRQELVARRTSITEALSDFDARIGVSDYLREGGKADARSAARAQWKRALEEVNRELRAAEEKLEGVDQEAMDAAGMHEAARRELARREHGSAASLQAQQHLALDRPDQPAREADGPARLGHDVLELLGEARQLAADQVSAWAEGIAGQAVPWSGRQLQVARAELGDVFGDFEAGLRRCPLEDRERWKQDWVREHGGRAALAMALDEASQRHRSAARIAQQVRALRDKQGEWEPGLEVKDGDYAEKVSGLAPEWLEAVANVLDPTEAVTGLSPEWGEAFTNVVEPPEGLPALERQRRDLVHRGASIAKSIAGFDARIAVSDYLGDRAKVDARSALKAQWERACEEVDAKLRAAEEQLAGVDQEAMDTAAMRRAVRRELARQGHDTGAPDLRQQAAESPGRDADGPGAG